ncbi:MAG: RNase adapter RapZ [Pseudomonadota bacterium]
MTETQSQLVLVTGPSGAGRSTALNALEDLGFEAIDNMPLSLLPRLLDGRPLDRPLALTLDIRNRDFAADALERALDTLRATPSYSSALLFLDCRPDVLLRRFSETRRRHPFSQDGAPAVGIRREQDLLAGLRGKADSLIDTSDMSPHDLRAALDKRFGSLASPGLRVTVESFSYKRGLPQDVDTAFDVRFLKNPHWVEDLRPLDGRDPRVAAHVADDPRFQGFFDRVLELVLMLLPAYLDEGKAHLSIGFGCTGGRHRSVMLAEKLGQSLADEGWQVSIRHRDL